ncbi:hypothetical protein RND81_07G160100 [Saponaria officinalis]|uniref:C-terminal processing peptidase n=2 Tax=Saponaria officinalis TaxID=3572 RepID=A0AAW1JNY7_SAPOF
MRLHPLPINTHHSLKFGPPLTNHRTTATTTTTAALKFQLPPTLISSALSLTLLLTPPLSSALTPPPPSPSQPSSLPASSDICVEDEAEFEAAPSPNAGTSVGIVEEAWEIVDQGFLDTASPRRWSPQSWLKKKEDILSSSITTRSKAHNIIQKMLASLGDPYTRFLFPEEFSKMSRYDMTGIGINLREVPDSNGGFKVKVLGILLDGPAHTAGIRQGDEILSVNGVDVRGTSAFEVSSLLQGPSETFVIIEVKHGNCGPVQTFKVQRQLVARTPVFYRLEQIDDGATSVGYVHLKEFNALAKKDIVIAIKRLQNLGASCFVLDLRDNFGGLVQAGIEIAKLFLDRGDTVIYTAGRDQSQNAVVADTSPLITAPVIVLVNHNTASASEIVASALHDNCRAVLVGERTYGKGLIQSVFELHDGSGVAVTIGKYVTPRHLDINGNGIEPDFANIPRWNKVAEQLATCYQSRRG